MVLASLATLNLICLSRRTSECLELCSQLDGLVSVHDLILLVRTAGRGLLFISKICNPFSSTSSVFACSQINNHP